MINYDEEISWDKAHDDSVDLFSDYSKVQYNVIYQFMQNDSFYLFHATTKEKYGKILKSKTIRTSGGCLAGGIYCTPIEQEANGELRLHNLGSYYYLVELPKAEFARTEQENKSKGMIFEILNPDRKAKLLGLNYMKFGQIFCRHYLKDQLNWERTIVEEINAKADYIIKESKEFILKTMSLYETEITYQQARDYMEGFNNSAAKLTLLGYVLFEAVSQYVAYYGTGENAQKYNQKHEIYNWDYKDMFFTLFPFLSVKFDLELIRFDEERFCDYIEKNLIIEHFDRQEFTTTIALKCIQIMVQECIGFINEKAFQKDERGAYPAALNSLLGHVVHRILKEEKYRESYGEIERTMAAEVREYWDKHDVLMVYNSGMAKGEMGINPSLINQYRYRIYECDGIENKEGFYYVKKGNEIDIKIQGIIIEYKESMLR